MPVQRGTEQKNGEKRCYYQWGENGKKYYYECGNPRSRKAARAKAAKQGAAAYASGYEG